MSNGVCGAEFWIADELWNRARSQPRDYDGFVRLVVRLLIADNVPETRRPHRAAPETPKELD